MPEIKTETGFETLREAMVEMEGVDQADCEMTAARALGALEPVFVAAAKRVIARAPKAHPEVLRALAWQAALRDEGVTRLLDDHYRCARRLRDSRRMLECLEGLG